MDQSISVAAGSHQTLHQRGVTLHLLHRNPRYQVFLIEAAPGISYDSAPHDGEELRYVMHGGMVFTVSGPTSVSM